jgi:maleate isomerase
VQLCREIEAATKARACTSVLALNEVLAITHAKRIALVSPYTPDVQARIIANYASIGIEVVSDVHWNLADNFSFSEVDEATIAAGIRAVTQAKPDAIAIYCTNLRGAALAADLEAECGIPIYDTVSTAVWKSLLLSGQDPSRITGWGRLFGLR